LTVKVELCGMASGDEKNGPLKRPVGGNQEKVDYSCELRLPPDA
jgi:hypothetical protein